MRYLIDTNIFVYATTDRDSLSRDVKAILLSQQGLVLQAMEDGGRNGGGHRK